MAGTVAPGVPTPLPGAPVDAARSYRGALIALTSLFFMWGFLTCLNDILTPHLKAIFDLSYTQAMTTQLSFFTAYFVMSTPAGWLVKRVGYKAGLIVGLLIAGAGSMLFFPAAAARLFPLFLTALFVLATGITVLQVAANPFVAILGDPSTASSRLTLTQAFNSLGTTLAPAFGSLMILSTHARTPAELATLSAPQLATYRVAEAHSVQLPYVGLSLALIVIAGVIAATPLPRIRAGGEPGAVAEASVRPLRQQRQLVFGVLAIFLYVGAEVAIGSFLVSFFKEHSIAALDEAHAAKWVSFYWGGAMVGRFAGTLTLRRFRAPGVLAVHAGVAAALVVLTILLSGHAAMGTILAVGLFNSIMFPTIFTLAIDGLGAQTSRASGLLCMAIVGGAILPVVQGALADRIGIHHSFVLPVLCYAYIAWYALAGSRPATAARA